jgi:hypothetical protein
MLQHQQASLATTTNEERIMEIKKPKNIDEKVWQQHLLWREVTNGECKANQQKREQLPKKDGRQVHY